MREPKTQLMSDKRYQDLQVEFENLREQSAGNADPVGFARLKSLVHRLSRADSNNPVLLEKTEKLLSVYKKNVVELQVLAKQELEKIERQDSHYFATAEGFYQNYQFQQISRLCKRLELQQQDAVTALREVTNGLETTLESEPAQQELNFEQLLFEQERNATAQAGEDLPPKQDGSGEQLELQAMKQFRASMKHFDIDKMIARALNECPENPGPHNPQMLAVKSLMLMRDLSPAYLRRFASNIETMLWLEKNSAKLTGQKKAL